MPGATHRVDAVEWSDKSGAERLARRLESYWLAQGHGISTWLDCLTTEKIGHNAIYGVRSNLVGGLPPKGVRA